MPNRTRPRASRGRTGCASRRSARAAQKAGGLDLDVHGPMVATSILAGARRSMMRTRPTRTSSLPEYSHQPRVGDVGVTRDERQGQASRRRAHERIERVIIRARVVPEVDVLGDEVDCLIGGVAEEIGEELTEGSPEIDAPHAGKEA